MKAAMNVVLFSTYELGRQPFGLASPAAWLREAGAQVTCIDLAVDALDEDAIRAAGLICFYVPMHTATRIAVSAVQRIRAFNSQARLCFYGLYASMNTEFLRGHGVDFILSGEFEERLVQLYRQLLKGVNGSEIREHALVSLDKLNFRVPARTDLPELTSYAALQLPDGPTRTVGYTEASRGCKHFCRHCPVVPVYQGSFRVVQPEIVLADIRNQVEAGAEHITFGDPDFFNGIGHATKLVQALHREFPHLTYDVTIKVEHLLNYRKHVPLLRETGCLFVVTAVESLDDHILDLLNKGHTEEDFNELVEVFREARLTLAPTFVTFTPWTTMDGYLYLLRRLAELGLTENVAPIQLAIRLLIPSGSLLLELPEVQDNTGKFDPAALCYPWQHPDSRMDELHTELNELLSHADGAQSRSEVFECVWEAAHRKAERPAHPIPQPDSIVSRVAIPYLTEPWYC